MPVAVIPSQFKPEETETAAEREQRTVHDVYESIAPHFSATRYKVSDKSHKSLVSLSLQNSLDTCTNIESVISLGLSYPGFLPMFRQTLSVSIQVQGMENTCRFYAHQVLAR